jgi:hypothetical protein
MNMGVSTTSLNTCKYDKLGLIPNHISIGILCKNDFVGLFIPQIVGS